MRKSPVPHGVVESPWYDHDHSFDRMGSRNTQWSLVPHEAVSTFTDRLAPAYLP